MIKTIIPSVVMLALLFFSSQPAHTESPETGFPGEEKAAGIEWKTLENASANKEQVDKKYFIYVYTDWCSWCKRMSGSTFQDEKVISILNDKFVPIKLNGEEKETISFNGRDFNYVQNGSRGYHELAAALLNGKLSYPSIVFLDEQMNMIQPLPGYKSAEDLSIILTFLGDKIYENMSFDDYYKQEKGEG